MSKKLKRQKRRQEAGGGNNAFMNATWHEECEGNMYTTVRLEDEIEEYMVDMAVNATKGIELTQVLLDNQADISVMHPMLLRDVRPARRKIRICGVGGVQLIVEHVGMLDGFFEVYASEKTKVNVLSFAEVEDKYEITYVRAQTFTVHIPEGEDIVFSRQNKLYVADWCVDPGVVNATVRENERMYTKEEVRRAKQAHEFLKCSGYPLADEAMHLITDSNVHGTPLLLKNDLERAYDIYGDRPEYVRGQMTKIKVGRQKIDVSQKCVQKSQSLYMDVMHIDTKKFLVSATEPLNLTLQSEVENEGKLALGMALQGQLAVLRSKGYVPEIVYMDPQSSFWSMTQDFPGVEIDVGGKRDYVSKADAKIRRIKDIYRKVKLGLPWKLPVVLVKDLVAYAVSRLNIRRTTSLNENVCPRVLFTGVPVDYKKELLLVFGDYVEAYEGTDNTSRARSSACIALHPASNATGSWVLWKIETRSRVQRSNVKKMVTTDIIIQAMNSVANESQLEEAEEEEEEVLRQQPAENSAEIGQITEEAEETPSRDQVEILPSGEAEAKQDTEEEIAEPEVAEAGEQIVTTRSGRSVIRPSQFVQVTKVGREDWKTEASTIAIKAELKMLFKDLKALRCVRRAEIKVGTKILKSHMFVVEKYWTNGNFDKMKVRLVADGRDQDATIYPDKSSPTVAIHSVFTALGLASRKPWRIVVKIDIKGAFVQTPMKGEPVYMRVDPKVSRYVIEMFPRLRVMLELDGCLYTLLLKAMYGCVQVSALWYALIRSFIEELGYDCSPTDRCVFRKRVGERIFVLLLYVDDILAQVDDKEAVRLREHLMRRFGEVQFEVGSKLLYLGMQIDIGDEGTMIDMSFYVKKLLEGASVKGQPSPGNHNSFIVDEHAQKLEESEKKYFHSTTAKLLYLAKRPGQIYLLW
jgi:hypothetical protein